MKKEKYDYYKAYKAMEGYAPKYGFQCLTEGLSRFEAERAFQLEPEPPKAENINEYIVLANQKKKLLYLCFYLHHIEKILNGRIYCFFHREGIYGYGPRRLMNYKLGCVEAMVERLTEYDPDKGADFLTYTYYDIGNAILDCRRYEESGSFKNLDEYKTIRGIAWLYNKSGDSRKKTIASFMEKTGCTEKTAENYLLSAYKNRSGISIYDPTPIENEEESDEDLSREADGAYGAFLWDRSWGSAVRRAHGKLNLREQILLEGHNAVCMECGHVMPLSRRASWEELAVKFEGTTASGAEKSYKKAVLHLAQALVEDGLFHTIRLKRKRTKKRKQKIAAATYQYQADCDGEWGEIQFDFEDRTAEIIQLADWDKTVSKPFAKYAISYLLNCKNENLPKETMITFDE